MIKLPSLHTNSEYSLLQSTIKIDDLITFALEKGLNSLVISDRNVMYGVSQFIAKCLEVKIKPIIGVDLDVENYRLILLAKNYQGYQHLSFLVTEKANQKTIALSQIDPKNIFIIDHPQFGHYAQFKKKLSLNNYFVGVDDLNLNDQNQFVFVQETKILRDVSENKILEILSAIENPHQKKVFNFKPYCWEFDAQNLLVQNAIKIINNCNFELPPFEINLPQFLKSENDDPQVYLKKLVWLGLEKMKIENDQIKIYEARINHELEIIKNLGYANYFLIIWDLVNFAKKSKILVGPGRGSVAGSLVAYLLNITEIDPLKYDLIFERFLNPDRVSLPDIDLDFEDTRREEVINYLFQKYHFENVALITTFQRLGPKMALRDVGRQMGINVGEIDLLTKTIPSFYNLEQVYKYNSRFRAMINKNPQYQILFKQAQLIEGLPRQTSTHAAGVVLSKEPIVSKVPTFKTFNNYNQVQFPMDYLEDYSLIKIDILSLRNLTVLQSIQNEIKNNFHKTINLNKIPLNDKLTNQLLTNGDTRGIFQLESSYGMKRTLMKVKVDSLDDLSAIISLYRPGPIDQIDLYAERKEKNQKISLDPSIDSILNSTYGIIVYQEQIIEITKRFANMSASQADLLRWSISKKETHYLESLKKIFYEGALKRGHNLELVDKVYGYIAKFAAYGFNKSHAIAYATLAYRLAYFKARFPFEFYSAILNSALGSIDLLKTYINEIKIKKINIVGPLLNKSQAKVQNDKNKLILPLSIIKGIGDVALNKILEVQSKINFEDFNDVVVKLKNNQVGDATLLTLIKANTLRLIANMNTLLNSLPIVIRYANLNLNIKDNDSLLEKPQLVVKEKDLDQEAKNEIEVFGFQINAFFTKKYESKTNLLNLPLNKEEELVVWLEKKYQIKTKYNQMMAIFICVDSSIGVEIQVLPPLWKEIKQSNINKLYKAIIKKEINQGVLRWKLIGKWRELKDER